jgi:hypothetical protein
MKTTEDYRLGMAGISIGAICFVFLIWQVASCCRNEADITGNGAFGRELLTPKEQMK